MSWIFAGVTLGAGVMATFVSRTRHAILALWVVGLGIGGIYLTLGAEFLAIIQWVVSTLVAISFVFFAVLFGEYSSSSAQVTRRNVVLSGLSLVLGGMFAVIIWLGAHGIPENFLVDAKKGDNLALIGRALTQDHLLSMEVLALTLFLVIVGGGVIARFEGGDSE